ncbi:type V toxin-antitoxin system endoribonuclease antitoxin GhoS [Serratia plymuthica]|uniref:type V toxin-antitoxin system endoribonuclease antitoxin GhoS n=1 Tax=Serratia plymuthica TaxID=82996 RepID=UPI001926AF52|nr:type V toxin-antitoxin system endoribonuclease antitoxin GhoS [Serratia plymuthica]MBL3524159.1 type V toxin-antitoxin system endoribonuclease antitoxin GhoS [Serratia plymuthica]
MADYVARVELFDADGENYETLHEKMKSLGFKREVTYSDGSVYNLPIGTYHGSSNSTSEALRDAIGNIGSPLSSKKPAVFVAKIDGWAAYLYSTS